MKWSESAFNAALLRDFFHNLLPTSLIGILLQGKKLGWQSVLKDPLESAQEWLYLSWRQMILLWGPASSVIVLSFLEHSSF